MLNLTRLHLGIAHESQFQGRGISSRASASGLRLTVQLSRRTVQLLTAFRDLLLRVPAALVLVICAAPVVLRAENHNPVFLPHSSSASRFTARAVGFFIFSQSGERPER